MDAALKIPGSWHGGRDHGWGISPKVGSIGLLLLAFVGSALPAFGAYTEPRLALTRATVIHAGNGGTTLKLDGSFSFPDALQLSLPITVSVTQGLVSAQMDLAGNVVLAGASAPPSAGSGVIKVSPREIVVVLPASFTSGPATVQVSLSADGQIIASNQLPVTL